MQHSLHLGRSRIQPIDSNKGSIYMSVFASDQRSPQSWSPGETILRTLLFLSPAITNCSSSSFFFSQVCITNLYYCINQLRTIYLGLGKLLIEMDHIRHALLLVYQCFFFNVIRLKEKMFISGLSTSCMYIYFDEMGIFLSTELLDRIWAGN